MNIAIIIAGGTGHRMGQDIPKQFINVYDKPVLIYTLEGFQKHPEIDAIEVVCIDGWHDIVWAYAKQFNIDKLKWIVSGGNTGQESIRNGVYNLEGKCGDDDIIIVHDGIRPLVDETVLTRSLSSTTRSALSSIFPVRLCGEYRRRRLTSSESWTGPITRLSRRRSGSTAQPILIR